VVKVKICGITNLKDAMDSVDAGCDALGFVFYRKSPRYITPLKARSIIQALPGSVVKIGVFADSKEKAIKNIAKSCKLDMLQFHGRETPEFCARFRNYPVIKAFRVKNEINYKDISRYKTFAYLFDTFIKSKIGGTGKKFDWNLARHIGPLRQPVFISGGLTHGNVREAIRLARPDWVDVSTSVEKHPGEKEPRRVRRFLKAAKG
jgi:phosphoribosylanthranilate isomerase